MKKIALLVSAAISAAFVQQPAFAESDTLKMAPLSVTADPFGNRVEDELISSVTVIAGDELNRRKATTLGETLDGLPGVTNSDFGPGVGRPVIRGLTGSRVQILNNGLKNADISGEGADHNVATDTGSATQIEVIRGPASLLYGGNASGGVINVINENFNPEFSDKTEVNGQISYGENGNEKIGNFGIALPVSDSFVVRSTYSTQNGDDFDINGFQKSDQTVGNKGTLQNSAVDTDSFSLTGLYSKDWGFAALGYSRWKTSYGLPEVQLGIGEEEQEMIKADYDRFDFRSELYDPIPGFHTARLKLAHTSYNQAEIGTHFHDGTLEESETEIEFDSDETEVRLELLHNPIANWNGVIGLQFNNRDFAADGAGHGGEEEEHHDDEEEEEGHEDEHGHGHDGFYVRQNETRSFGLFILENKEVSFGNIELAARIDYVDSKPSSLSEERHIEISEGNELEQEASISDRNFTPFSLSAGSIIPLNDDYHVRVALSRSQRAPSAEQLYAFGEHHSAGTVEIGDPNLGKETYTNLEVGLDKHHGPFTFNVTTFYNDVDDFIFLETQQENGSIVTIDDNLLVSNRQHDAKFYGAEFTSAWRISEGELPLTLRFSGDYVRAKLSDGENLPLISPARLGIGFDTSYHNVDFTMDYRHVFSQDDTAEYETKTDGFDLVSFDANWKPSSSKGLSFFVRGRNLLDEDGRRHQSFLKDSAPIIGRSVFVGVNFDLSI